MPDTMTTIAHSYCNSLTEYSRRKTTEVYIGNIAVGGTNPIRVQSMTTVDTMDTEGTIQQSIRMIEAGCEFVRITAPSINESRNLENIKKGLIKKGYNTPLIADIHFTPNAAETAARIVEKVRINPGNYADKKKFETIDYSDYEYEAEIDRIRARFIPLVKICKEYGTAMRIGTNHGSLSDRIMSRYGDTPLGMVESALEFLRISKDLNYHEVVLSMKASNTQVMVEAYRLLVNKLEQEEMLPYPLHLGVTEAGEGEDGRIKSALGIGTLLEDGLGDTIRVSLTEEPELEIPVARALLDRYTDRSSNSKITAIYSTPINPFQYSRRATSEILNIGAKNAPRVIADLSSIPIIRPENLKPIGHHYLPEIDKWTMTDQGADFVYTGKSPMPFMPPNGLKQIIDHSIWLKAEDKESYFPLVNVSDLNLELHNELNFVLINAGNLNETILDFLKTQHNIVAIVESSNNLGYAEIRRFLFELIEKEIQTPVIVKRSYGQIAVDEFQLYSAVDVGGLLIDGLGDGICLTINNLSLLDDIQRNKMIKTYNKTAFGILQAARTRMSKTEYISCPSCGRTLFDLQETTALIRKRTDHLKGLKIGVMGCIVNGPGEMADADYGYVGSGKGKITLYRGKEVVKRGVSSQNALEEMIRLIKEDGNWLEPEEVLTN
ncbi:MAG: (E)-4-hydroxy-3-methylbut-2-enyl-diphosphate synthase [Bacteroidetes bacterium]|nr:(E)-4-hydroxy-3-methylbut-2-enyl-diphosphate synthase [Bacteroidota bacterium]MDA1122008.1 (E)-4-hydroxy-3-methylbut-2-enyl-diphosphate synthase [Bacteroidota bacterium]